METRQKENKKTTIRGDRESMKGMGSYTKVEEELKYYSADEMNELFLSGGLDKIYDDFEREREAEHNEFSGLTAEEIEAFADESDEAVRKGQYIRETVQ